MAGTFDDDVLQSGLRGIQAERMRAQAEYMEASAYGNTEDGLVATRRINACDREAQDLINLHTRAVAQNTPRQPVYQTPEEWRVKSADKMTPEDGLQCSRNSKYGKDLDFNDANVRRGWDEMQRRRGRGE